MGANFLENRWKTTRSGSALVGLIVIVVLVILVASVRWYLMAKGQFLVAESDFDKNTLHHRGGAIYIRGWLNRDYSVSGAITITSDEKYSEELDWKAAGPVKN